VVVIALGIISLMMFIVAVVSDESARSLLIFASATLGLALAAGAMILRTARR
jgi:uncharacterized membrane protein YqjE